MCIRIVIQPSPEKSDNSGSYARFQETKRLKYENFKKLNTDEKDTQTDNVTGCSQLSLKFFFKCLFTHNKRKNTSSIIQ